MYRVKKCLGVISVGLGVISVGLGVISLAIVVISVGLGVMSVGPRVYLSWVYISVPSMSTFTAISVYWSLYHCSLSIHCITVH